MIRVVLVEDHPAIGAGLAAVLADEPDLDVIGRASEAGHAADLIRSATPDVVLCDVMLGGTEGGLDVLRSVAGEGARFLMFSAYAYPAMYRAAIEAGASGYLSKTAPIGEIVGAIRTVSAGGRVFPTAVLRSAGQAHPRPSSGELAILRLIAQGATNRRIASERSISIKTVESQLRRLFDRYDVANRTELARFAEREGWLVADTL